MNLNQKIGIALIVVLVGLLYSSHLNERKARLERLKTDYAHKLQKAQHYATLKRSWGDKKSSQKLLNRLKQLKRADKRLKQSKRIRLLYTKLNASMLDQLSQAILSSSATITLFELKKRTDGVDLSLELEL